MGGLEGFVYPNEHELSWSVLIALYPFITGLVAGAFILASLERVFDVKALRPTYRLSLLGALAFLLVAPMPLLAHLHQPQRGYEIMATPNPSSAMAVFGFVYLWYLTVILLVEVWLEFRVFIVKTAQASTGVKRAFYYALSLGVTDTSEKAERTDHRIGTVVTIVGIPSAILLHGYVGFIFGSVKANPWWSSVMMPVVFIFSAIVSGIALMLVLYLATSLIRRVKPSDACIKAMGKYLFYALLVAFTLEMLDMIHRAYEAEESIDVIHTLMGGRMFDSIVVVQVIAGSVVPLIALGVMQVIDLTPRWRRLLSWEMGLLILIGVFTMRWNVVIGGQLFSKSLRGFTIYKLGFVGREGVGVALFLTVLPLFIFAVLAKLLPPWVDRESDEASPDEAEVPPAGPRRRAAPIILAALPLLALVVQIAHSPTAGSEMFTRPTPETPPSTAPGIFRPEVAAVEVTAGEESVDESGGVPDTEVSAEPSGPSGAGEPSEPGDTNRLAAQEGSVVGADSTRTFMDEQCGMCHEVYDPASYSEADWESWISEMRDFAELDDSQVQELLRYRSAIEPAVEPEGTGSSVAP